MDTSSSSPTGTNKQHSNHTSLWNTNTSDMLHVRTYQREWLDPPLDSLSGPTGRDGPNPESKWTASWECQNPTLLRGSPPLINNTSKKKSIVLFTTTHAMYLCLLASALHRLNQPDCTKHLFWRNASLEFVQDIKHFCEKWKRIQLTLSHVCFVYEAWKHMTILNAEVVMRTKHICRNHSCIAVPMLLEVRPVKRTHCLLTSITRTETFTYKHVTTSNHTPVLNINHSLCIGIAIVWLMGWTVMDLEG